MSILRVRVVQTGVGGSPWYMNHYFVGSTSAQASASVDAVRSCYLTISDVVAAGVITNVLDEVLVVDEVTGQIEDALESGGGAVITNTAAGDYLPRATCALIQYNTGIYRYGRQIKGKTFLGGMVEPNSTSLGTPSSALRGELTAAFETLVPGAPDFVVWSRPKKATPLKPARPGDIATITSATAWTEFAVLRSHRN